MKQSLVHNFYIQKYIFRFIPLYAVMKIITSVITAALEFFLFTYSFKYVMDSIEAHRRFFDIVPVFIAAGAVTLAVVYMKKWMDNQYLPVCREKLAQKMKSRLLEKAAAADLACYDDPYFYDRFMNAHKNADTTALAVFHTHVELLEQLLSIFGFFALLIVLDTIGLVFAVTGFVSGSIINIIYNKLTVQCELIVSPLYRKRDYTGRIFFLPDYAKELRLSSIHLPLIQHFEAAIKDITAIHCKYGKTLIFLRLTHFAATVFLTNIVYLVILIYKITVLKTISIGTFTALYLCMDKLGYWLPVLTETVTDCFKHSLHAGLFRTAENYKNTVQDTGTQTLKTEPADIRINKVCFRYPGCAEPVLHDISLYIRKHEKIAIVGYNGSGKSTLVKLLLRLYDPDAGSLTVHDNDIRSYSLQTYRNYIGAVFQDFQTYACTLAENIAMETDVEPNRVADALEQSGLHRRVSGGQKGLYTELGRELHEDGLLFSGGELQKLALARVFYRQFPCIIFDEPSAALDPISEQRFYAAIRGHFRESTVIFVSHRLAGTKDADRIYMMAEGRIIEQGTHTELMNINGEYARLFRLQAEKYTPSCS